MTSWREGALTRVAELQTLTTWLEGRRAAQNGDRTAHLVRAIDEHLEAAKATAERSARRTKGPWFQRLTGAEVERVRSNLDAAEIDLLRLAPMEYLGGQVPTLLAHARQHLQPRDPRLVQLERIAKDGARGQVDGAYHEAIVAAAHSANVEARAEVRRVRSFRNVLFLMTGVLTAAAVAIAVIGALNPQVLPLCFTAEDQVVCPTQSAAVAGGEDADATIRQTASAWDFPLVELLGLIAAALAGATAVRGISGTSTPYSVPVALALLKLPAGALTAVLGLIAIRGGFVPGLSALDTSGQILAWAVAFGYAQQLFSRFVDRRAQTVLDDVGGSTAPAAATPP